LRDTDAGDGDSGDCETRRDGVIGGDDSGVAAGTRAASLSAPVVTIAGKVVGTAFFRRGMAAAARTTPTCSKSSLKRAWTTRMATAALTTMAARTAAAGRPKTGPQQGERG
jgi:hypothetical protein